MNQVLGKCFSDITSQAIEMDIDVDIRFHFGLFQKVLSGFASLREACPAWADAFRSSPRIDIRSVDTSPLFLAITLTQTVEGEDLSRLKASALMTSDSLGLSGETEGEIRFLNLCWFTIIQKALSVIDSPEESGSNRVLAEV